MDTRTREAVGELVGAGEVSGRSGSVGILVVAVEVSKIVKFVDTLPPSSPSSIASLTLFLFIRGHDADLAPTVVADCRRVSGTGGVCAGTGRGPAMATVASAKETAFRRRGAGTGDVGGGGLLDFVGDLNAGVTMVESCLRRGGSGSVEWTWRRWLQSPSLSGRWSSCLTQWSPMSRWLLFLDSCVPGTPLPRASADADVVVGNVAAAITAAAGVPSVALGTETCAEAVVPDAGAVVADVPAAAPPDDAVSPFRRRVSKSTTVEAALRSTSLTDRRDLVCSAAAVG